MERYLREHQFQTYAFRGEWSDLRNHLSKGRPLIVALKPTPGDTLHYVVVTGLDSHQDLVLVNDPAQRKLLKFARDDFEKDWRGAEKATTALIWLALAGMSLATAQEESSTEVLPLVKRLYQEKQ